MKLSKWHMFTHVLLAASFVMIGWLFRLVNEYQSRLASWKLAARKCANLIEGHVEQVDKFFR